MDIQIQVQMSSIARVARSKSIPHEAIDVCSPPPSPSPEIESAHYMPLFTIVVYDVFVFVLCSCVVICGWVFFFLDLQDIIYMTE